MTNGIMKCTSLTTNANTDISLSSTTQLEITNLISTGNKVKITGGQTKKITGTITMNGATSYDLSGVIMTIPTCSFSDQTISITSGTMKCETLTTNANTDISLTTSSQLEITNLISNGNTIKITNGQSKITGTITMNGATSYDLTNGIMIIPTCSFSNKTISIISGK